MSRRSDSAPGAGPRPGQPNAATDVHSPSLPRAGAGMTRIVTLGDSITMGMGDPAPGGGGRAGAQSLAAGLERPKLHNLAIRGAQAKHVERDQLPAALELRADIASRVVGVNAHLQAGFDPVRT